MVFKMVTDHLWKGKGNGNGMSTFVEIYTYCCFIIYLLQIFCYYEILVITRVIFQALYYIVISYYKKTLYF
jgi:hypothetical protein